MLKGTKEFDMTRKELVDILNKSYAEDDEVYVRYLDDQGECIDKAIGVDDIVQTHVRGHHEVIDSDGNWRRLREDEDAWSFSRNDIRYVDDDTYTTTKRCIMVG